MPRLSPLLKGRARSLAMLGVSVAAFALLIVLTPYGQRYPWLALALFVGVLGLFKLLSQFEKPAQ